MSLSARNTSLSLSTWIDISVNELGQLSLNSTENRGSGACLTWPIRGLKITDGSLGLGSDVLLDMTPVDASGKPELSPATTQLELASALKLLAPGVGHMVNDLIAKSLEAQHNACSGDYPLAAAEEIHRMPQDTVPVPDWDVKLQIAGTSAGLRMESCSPLSGGS